MNAAEYVVALTASLRAENLTMALYSILTAIGSQQAQRGFATYPAITMSLGCSYNNVYIHVCRNRQFFTVDERHSPSRISLTPCAIKQLAAVKTLVDRRLSQPAIIAAP